MEGFLLYASLEHASQRYLSILWIEQYGLKPEIVDENSRNRHKVENAKIILCGSLLCAGTILKLY